VPTESTWLLDKRVLYFRVYGEVTLDNIAETMQTQMRFHEEGIAPIHTLIDLRTPAFKVPSLAQIRKVGGVPLHPSTGWMLLMGGERGVVSFAVSLIIQLSGAKTYRPVKSLEEAVDFLNHNDPTLNLSLEAARTYIANRPVYT
jgi:hypothetical protein